MGTIIIKKICYYGDNYYFESPDMDEGIVIFEAANGHGKTTLMNLLYYGLGGRVAEFRKTKNNPRYHAEIAEDTNNRVEITIRINSEIFKFTRYFHGDDVIVIVQKNDVLYTKVNRNTQLDYIVFSDWLLKKLSIKIVDYYVGTKSFTIGIRDLMRLMYYDQLTENIKIFKTPDDNFIDSTDRRKTIFEVLMGKNYDEYYQAVGNLKSAEKTADRNKDEWKNYQSFIKSSFKDFPSDNTEYILNTISTSKLDVIRLEQLLDVESERKDSSTEITTHITKLKQKLTLVNEKTNSQNQEIIEIYNKTNRFIILKNNLLLELDKIKKSKSVHSRLNLFREDTCPYCLNEVNRTEGNCVCGNKIDEIEYIKFFYDENDYNDLISSKQKTIQKLSIVIQEMQQRIYLKEQIKKDIENEYLIIIDGIKGLTNDLSKKYNTTRVRELSKSISNKKEYIKNLGSILKLKKQSEILSKKIQDSSNDLKLNQAKINSLESRVKQDIFEKVTDMSIVYSEAMMKTMGDVEVAGIDIDNYMPVVNNGRYSPSSSTVSYRLMYFFALLKISILYDDVKYPKFLMLDTPQDKGIDIDNIKSTLGVFADLSKLIKNKKKHDYQVIITTGPNVYPIEFEKYIVYSEKNKIFKKNGIEVQSKLLIKRIRL